MYNSLNQGAIMQNQKDYSSSELITQNFLLKPQFNSSQEAIDFFSEKLELICSNNGKSVQEFLYSAEQNLTYNPDMLKALSIARLIKSLRGQNERKARMEYF